MRGIPEFRGKDWGRISEASFKEPVSEATVVEGEFIDLCSVEGTAFEGGEIGGEL